MNLNFPTGTKIAYALTGSFCTFEQTLEQMEVLVAKGAQVIPIMSETAYSTDTRFGNAREFHERIKRICYCEIIHTIVGAEPIGPKKMADVLIVAPCTGNTLAKLANSITDTCVTMAVKSHIRNSRPVILCVSTNDALAGSAKNIGKLMSTKHYYFVPMRQDDYAEKPTSLVADFSLIPETIIHALNNKQLQPVLF
ncbi:MAG: dipicolinate synthase subunit B [Oscillospiraceae bacterium]|nr:dipicolinate synthase subunit B [Oscillospiraceae bacterium]